MTAPVTESFWVQALSAEVRHHDAAGATTRCIEAGSGPPVILLHGLSGHAETWIRNVGVLAERFHVYAIDMLGHGFTAKPPIDYSVGVLAEHVLDFMDAVGLARASMVGQSLGGWVAGWLAVHHPERVTSLVSATGAGLQITDDGEQLTKDVGAKVATATTKALDAPTRDKVRARLEWLMHDPSTVTDELVETRYRIYSAPDFVQAAPRLVSGLTGPLPAGDMLTADSLAKITCPTLVLWTRHNPTMPWEVGEAASKIIPGARFYLMEDAGHWPQFERPGEFHDVVVPFLTEHADR